jgi:hypothetical protein
MSTALNPESVSTSADFRLRSNGFDPADERSYWRLFAMDHFLGRDRVDRLFKQWRSDLRKSMLESIRQNGEARPVPVPRGQNIPPRTFFKEFRRRNQPVVFDRQALDWECCRKWTFDLFKARYGRDEVILFDRLPEDRTPFDKPMEHIRLADLIDGIDHGSLKYARFNPLLQKHPELRQDINQKWLKDYIQPHRSFMRLYWVFFGGKGTNTPIHNAGSGNLFVQVTGRKKWRLYPVEHSPVLDPQANRSVYKFTGYRPDEPDYSRYPMARHMDWYETILEPGDVLYIPPYYWHEAANLTSSIAVASRWVDLSLGFRAASTLFCLEGFNTNPNIVQALRISLNDFNKVLEKRASQRSAL